MHAPLPRCAIIDPMSHSLIAGTEPAGQQRRALSRTQLAKGGRTWNQSILTRRIGPKVFTLQPRWSGRSVGSPPCGQTGSRRRAQRAGCSPLGRLTVDLSAPQGIDDAEEAVGWPRQVLQRQGSPVDVPGPPDIGRTGT